MRHGRVKKLFPDWMDGRVEESLRSSIRDHLDSCPECRSYYEGMSLLLSSDDPSLLPVLEPDPRPPIGAREAGGWSIVTRPRPGRLVWARLSIAGSMFVFALALGFLLGRGMAESSIARAESREDDIIAAYQELFDGSGIEEEWTALLEEQEVGGER